MQSKYTTPEQARSVVNAIAETSLSIGRSVMVAVGALSLGVASLLPQAEGSLEGIDEFSQYLEDLDHAAAA